MNDRVVCKFGGTSLATADQFRKVRRIVESDPRRVVVVVSAPGKKAKDDAKITDLLLHCYESHKLAVGFEESFHKIESRFKQIKQGLGLVKTDVDRELAELRAKIMAGANRDYVAAFGERMSAILMAEFLGATFVDPMTCVHIGPEGQVEEETYQLLGKELGTRGTRYVLPGFYGRDQHGNIKTFSRGGSDISGALAARAAGAALYENWTDVSGLLMADPRVVKNPRPMREVTYEEMGDLAYLGASVLHHQAVQPAREAGITIVIKNTEEPSHPGTRIVASIAPDTHAFRIAGIAGKDTFMVFSIGKVGMNGEVGIMHEVLGVFLRHAISVEHVTSGVDSMSIIVPSMNKENAAKLQAEIQSTVAADTVTVIPDLALIAVVGQGIRYTEVPAQMLSILHHTRVRAPLTVGASELSVTVGVPALDYQRATQALYSGLVE